MIAKEKKQAIIAEYGRTPGDTGSPEVQIAILTARIEELNAHLAENKKRLSFKTWSFKDGWSEKKPSCIPQEQGYRGIQKAHREPWT